AGPAPPATSPLPLHDALPISATRSANTAIQAPRSRGTEPRDSITSTQHSGPCARPCSTFLNVSLHMGAPDSPSWRLRASLEFVRSEEHTSELQSLTNLVCRLL